MYCATLTEANVNEWAKHYGGSRGYERRVYQREFEATLGYRTTWFRALEKRGVIPPGKRDPGGKRKWWLASEVAATVERLNATAEVVAA